MYKLLILITGFFISFYSIAHEGHDHADPMSPYIHLLWIVTLIAVAVVLYTMIKRRIKFLSKRQHKGVAS